MRLVQEHRVEYGSQWAAIQAISIAAKVGGTAETLRQWVRHAARCPGLATEDQQQIKLLERELRRANEIPRKASAYFAQAEFDRRETWWCPSSMPTVTRMESSRSARCCPFSGRRLRSRLALALSGLLSVPQHPGRLHPPTHGLRQRLEPVGHGLRTSPRKGHLSQLTATIRRIVPTWPRQRDPFDREGVLSRTPSQLCSSGEVVPSTRSHLALPGPRICACVTLT